MGKRNEMFKRRALLGLGLVGAGYALGNRYPISTVLRIPGAVPNPTPPVTEKATPEPSAAAAASKPASPVVVRETVIVPVTPERTPIPAGARAFEDKDANEIAEAKGITVGDFFKFRLDTLNKLDAFRGPELYPIYPPSVMKWKGLIYDLAKKFQLPPNVVATIMTIESAGDQHAVSPANAQGLFQVMPFHFPDDIQTDYEKMQKPDLNGTVGMNFFSKLCLPAAQTAISGKGDGHVNVYAKALISYNGGPGVAPYKFEDLEDESKLYGDYFIRFALTAEIAEGLRKKGFYDSEIIDKLRSKNLDARSYAYQQFRRNTPTSYLYDVTNQALVELSKPNPGEDEVTGVPSTLGIQLKKYFDDYMKDPQYEVPLSPGLRMWVSAFTGYDGFAKSPENLKKESYYSMNSRR